MSPLDARALPHCLIAGLALCLPLQVARAQGGPPRAVPPVAAPSAKPEPPKPDATLDAARIAFEAMSETERRALQDALVWTGDFAGVVAGTFGRRTYDAIVAHQRAAGVIASGILDQRERASLLAAGLKARESAGFAIRQDGAAGVALGVPGKLLPREAKMTGGSRWQSADGRITLETRAFAPGEADLQATFDRVSVATPQRKVTYKLKRPDFLVVSGETPTGRFFIRYAATSAGVRGFTVSYDKTIADFDRVVIAISNSFDPEPGRPGAAVPAVSSTPGAGTPPVAVSKTGARFATALAVAPGRVLTSVSGLKDCATPRIDGLPARVSASDAQSGLALLAVDDARAPPPLMVGPEATPGAALVVLAWEAGRASVVPSQAAATGQVVASLQPGSAGAPVFDHAGNLVGLIAIYPSTPASVAGVVLPMPFAMTPVGAAAGVLRRAGISLKPGAETAPRSTGEIAARHASSLRALTCE